MQNYLCKPIECATNLKLTSHDVCQSHGVWFYDVYSRLLLANIAESLHMVHKTCVSVHQSILRFWLDAGVDGFRVNSARYLVEDYEQRDETLAYPGHPECQIGSGEAWVSLNSRQLAAKIAGCAQQYQRLLLLAYVRTCRPLVVFKPTQ